MDQVKLSFAPVVKRPQGGGQYFVQAGGASAGRSSLGDVRRRHSSDRVEGSLGSGVIVRSDGVIVTNNHVIEGGQEITVSLEDRREFPAKVLLADPRADLAVLKIEG